MLAGYLGADLGAGGFVHPETPTEPPTLQHLSEYKNLVEHAAAEVAADSQFYFNCNFLSFALITRTPPTYMIICLNTLSSSLIIP